MTRDARWANRKLSQRIDIEATTCCHPDCYAPSTPELASTIPLCENHVYRTYRATNAFLGTQTAVGQEYELLPAEAEYIPGPCPACGTAGLLVVLANGIVTCKASSCGYEQSQGEFGAQRKTLMGLAAGDREVVYYMRLGNRAKIGTSRNLQSRLRCFNPEDCMAYELGGRSLERRRHQQFHHLRVVGEWFDLNSELTRHINALDVA